MRAAGPPPAMAILGLMWEPMVGIGINLYLGMCLEDGVWYLVSLIPLDRRAPEGSQSQRTKPRSEYGSDWYRIKIILQTERDLNNSLPECDSPCLCLHNDEEAHLYILAEQYKNSLGPPVQNHSRRE